MEKKIKQFIDCEIEKYEDICNMLHDIRLNDYAIIEYTFETEYNDKPYWHKGIYQLLWNLKEGLFFNIVALKLEENPIYGLTQWRLRSTIPIKNLYMWSDGTTHLNMQDYGTNTATITKTNKEEIFKNTELSFQFVVSSLDKIKKSGKEVSYTLYPWENNKEYDFEKTYMFIKENIDVI